MNKSSKMVSLFLASALLFGTTACSSQPQVVYDQDGNPTTVEEEDDDGFFAPFGFSKKHSAKHSAVTSGGSTYPNSVDPNSSSSSVNKAGVSSGSNSTAGTGVTSGTHGGIGGGGSSAS